MSILNNILKAFVGDKTKKDLNNITPIVAEIKSFEKQLEEISHDDLRAKTTFFKKALEDARAPFHKTIEKLKQEVKNTHDLYQKEMLYQQLDEHNETAQNA